MHQRGTDTRAEESRGPRTSSRGYKYSPSIPFFPPPLVCFFCCWSFSCPQALSHTQHAAAQQMNANPKLSLGKAAVPTASAETAAPMGCTYLAGFQDVDLFLVHRVPVFLQKSLALVLHLARDKGKSPEVAFCPPKSRQRSYKALCPRPT